MNANGRAASARTVTAADDDAGQRIDNYLLRALREVPRTRVYRLLRRGEVRVNGGRVRPGYRITAGDRIRIPPVRAERHAGGELPEAALRRLADAVLYEDESALVIDKPAGLAVHAGSGLGGGVIDGLRQLRPDLDRLELVHRLDRDTSGCLLLAKGRAPLRALQDELRAGGFTKVYAAVLLGQWAGPEAAVDLPLRRDAQRAGERIVVVDRDGGRAAHSRFRRLGGGHGATLAEVEIATGRTHQIRVHAAALGHPVVGDRKYGDPGRERALLGERGARLYLHAWRLELTGEAGRIRVESPLPAAFEALMAADRENG